MSLERKAKCLEKRNTNKEIEKLNKEIMLPEKSE